MGQWVMGHGFVTHGSMGHDGSMGHGGSMSHVGQ